MQPTSNIVMSTMAKHQNLSIVPSKYFHNLAGGSTVQYKVNSS